MKHLTFTLSTAALAACACSALARDPSLPSPAAAAASQNSETWADGDYFFGNWAGIRPRLADAGVTFESYYVANPAGLVSGGREHGHGFTYVDNFYLGVTFDLEKLVGWRGAQFAVSGINRSGGSLTLADVGSQYDVQQVHGGQNVFLYNLTLEQRFWQDKAKIKIGRFGASDDFNSSPIYGLYMNNGIDGNIRNVLFDTQFSAYPFATWAARLRVDPTPEVNLQFGVFQTWDNVFNRRLNGLNWDIRDSDGVILMAQAGWTPEFFKRPVPSPGTSGTTDGKSDSKADGKSSVAPEMKGLPGHYWIGGSYSPWKGYNQFGLTEKTTGSYGFWAHGDQMVYQESPGSEQGLTVFVASGYYPQDNISIIPWQLNVGAFYTGLFPGRDRDKTIVGLIHGRFGDGYADTFQATGRNRPTQETVLELGYRVQFSKFAYIQPDVQFVTRPGGTGTIDDAIVVGAQVGISF